VAARSKAWVCGQLLAGLAGLSTAGGHGCLSLVSECCILSGRGLCEGPIPRPEESYRVCVCVCVCVCVTECH
jgi:hypothetical protein